MQFLRSENQKDSILFISLRTYDWFFSWPTDSWPTCDPFSRGRQQDRDKRPVGSGAAFRGAGKKKTTTGPTWTPSEWSPRGRRRPRTAADRRQTVAKQTPKTFLSFFLNLNHCILLNTWRFQLSPIKVIFYYPRKNVDGNCKISTHFHWNSNNSNSK